MVNKNQSVIYKKVSETLKRLFELREQKKKGKDVKDELSKTLKELKRLREEKKKLYSKNK